MSIWHRYFFVFLSGTTAALAFSHVWLWPLGILSFSFYIYVLKNTATLKKSVAISILYGFPFMAGSILWWFGSFPLSSNGINEPVMSAFLLTFTWIVVAGTLALSHVLFGLLFIWFRKNSYIDILLVAGLLVVTEVLRTLFFYVLTISPASLFGMHWTFGFAGYVLSGSPLLLQLASFGGVYLLGFVFALLATSLVYVPISIFKRIALFSVIVAVSYVPFPQHEVSLEPTLYVVALKTTESSYFNAQDIDRLARFGRITELIEKVSETNTPTNLIVLPEDSRFIDLQSDAQLENTPIGDSYILDSSRIQLPQEAAYSRIMTYSKSEGVTLQYTKRLLVPESEYLSSLYRHILTLLGLKEKVTTFDATKALAIGTAYTATNIGAEILAASSLCSEIYSPHAQLLLSKKAGLIINIGSHSRLQGSDILFNQIVAMSKVRAVENGKYLVRSTNFDDSFVISATGNVVAMTNPDKPFDFTYYEVPILYERTLFSRAPYAIPILSLIIVLVFVVRRRYIKS